MRKYNVQYNRKMINFNLTIRILSRTVIVASIYRKHRNLFLSLEDILRIIINFKIVIYRPTMRFRIGDLCISPFYPGWFI